MSKWIGVGVSVTCSSPLGCYQGTILEADGATITLTKAFRNGFPYPKSQVTLNASDIRELSIISAAGGGEGGASTVPRAARARARARVCETLQPHHTPHTPHTPGPQRSEPIDIRGNNNRNHRNNNNSAGSGEAGAGAGSTPRSRGGAAQAGGAGWRRRDEACFGAAAADAAGEGEFDFEKNLALFDKQALWQQMRSAKPDLVRQTESAGAGGAGGTGGATGSYRHDENVVGGRGAARAARAARHPVWAPPHARSHLLYATDEGVIVPSVQRWVRRALWAALQAEEGEGGGALLLLARACADVALRLVGGGRRLDPSNAHQPPAVALLYTPHRIGACGLMAARLLSSHGACVTSLCAGAGAAVVDVEVAAARAAAAACGVTEVACMTSLPAADLIIIATHDPFHAPDDDEEYEESAAVSAALAWAQTARGALLGVEPPPRGWPGLDLRASVVALLPAAGSSRLGRLHLANVAPPPRVFTALGLRYRPPFGAAAALPLHPADDQATHDD